MIQEKPNATYRRSKRRLHVFSKKDTFDFVVALSLIYIAFSSYEISNYISLLLLGSSPKILFQWAMPYATIGISTVTTNFLFLKPLQVALASLPFIIIFIFARRFQLRISSIFSMGVLAMNLTSFYWEYLPGSGSSAIIGHQLGYVIISGLTFTLMMFMNAAHSRNISERTKLQNNE